MTTTGDRLVVRVAGYNIPAEAIPEGETPESITAAYARISRSPKTIEELRREAREHVDRARKSNERIVYGMGHASISEHACLNLDLEGISRLALELVERHRLASYTERSQRYVRLSPEPWIPQELSVLGIADEFGALQERAISLYTRMVEEGIPREDARYVLPMSVEGQVGVTVNARTLEHMILFFFATPLAEVRELGRRLLESTRPLIPSLIRYVEPSDYHRREAEMGLVGGTPAPLEAENVAFEGAAVGMLRPVRVPTGMEAHVAALRYARNRGISIMEAQEVVSSWPYDRLERFLREMYAGATIHDPLPRELEHITITWEMVLSSAAFAQLKRHRIVGVTWSRYHPALGFTLPPSLESSAHLEEIHALREQSEALFRAVEASPAAAYVLLGGHRRRVFWTANLREHFHFSRLREDVHAQWDIRAFAMAMGDLLRAWLPTLGSFLGGKSDFESRS